MHSLTTKHPLYATISINVLLSCLCVSQFFSLALPDLSGTICRPLSLSFFFWRSPAAWRWGLRATYQVLLPGEHLPRLGRGHRSPGLPSVPSHSVCSRPVLGGLHWAGGTDRLINPPMRCSTWRGNDLTKLNRQVQLWVCPRFKPPTPQLCTITVFLLSFIPSASCRSNSFTILSPSPLRGIETPQQVYKPQTDPEYPLKLSSQ